MKKMNPIERSKYIDDHYKEYLRSSFEFGMWYVNLLEN